MNLCIEDAELGVFKRLKERVWQMNIRFKTVHHFLNNLPFTI